MYKGHYTLSDITKQEMHEAKNSHRKNRTISDEKHLVCEFADSSKLIVWADMCTIEIKNKKQTYALNFYGSMLPIDKIPVQYKPIALKLMAQIRGRGGKRRGAGREKTAAGTKPVRTFRLDDYEYIEVKKFIAKLRIELK